MSQENSYNPTSLAHDDGMDAIFENLKQYADNPLVKQFSLKSYQEIIAAEHNIEKKIGKLDSHSKDEKVLQKIALYEDYLGTLEILEFQCINFTAKLMTNAGEPTLEVDAEDVTEIVEEKKEHGPEFKEGEIKEDGITKSDVVHNNTKSDTPNIDELEKIAGVDDKTVVVDAETNLSEEPKDPIVALPAWAIEDKEVKAIMHDVIKKGETKENLIAWLKDMVANKMFVEGSKILGTFTRAEFSDERYAKYIDQMITNPAPDKEEEEETSKSEVTEIKLPEKLISFKHMKEEVRRAYKDNVSDEVVDKYVLGMIDGKLIKGGSKTITSKKERLDWEHNVKTGVENARKANAKEEKADAKMNEKDASIEDILPEVKEDDSTSTELLQACQSAENELKAGNRDKAIGIIKHYLDEYGGDAKGTFKDLDIQRLLNWIDEDVFHHRNPMDLLHNILLSLPDVIKEVERQVKLYTAEDGTLKEGSRKSIQDLIFSKVDGVKMREHKSNDDIITDKKEFNVWFERMCGFVFRNDNLKDEFKDQIKFEQDFEEVIRTAGSERGVLTQLTKQYKKEAEEFGSQLGLSDALKIIRSKLEALNPELKAVDDEHRKKKKGDVLDTAAPIPLPASTKENSVEDVSAEPTESKEDGSSETDSSGDVSVKSDQPLFSEKNKPIWDKAKKLKSLKQLTNFILKNPKVGSSNLYGLARELITSNRIKDAVMEFKKGETPVVWDLQQISNWFRLGPATILESIGILDSKNTVEFKKALQKYITRNPKLEQDVLLKKVSELMCMDVYIRSNYVGKQAKHKDLTMNLRKLYEEVLEENHVHTT